MKKHFDTILLGAATIITVALIIIAFAGYAKADEVTPQIVYIDVLPTPTPRPVWKPVDEDIPEYKLDSSDVKRIAKLLWSSPLTSETQKERLVWLVLNRVDHYESTVHDVINTDEFTYFDYHARVSDKNRKIVERVMNLWLAEKDGYSIGRRPPKDALYGRFCGENNRKIDLLEFPSGRALVW